MELKLINGIKGSGDPIDRYWRTYKIKEQKALKDKMRHIEQSGVFVEENIKELIELNFLSGYYYGSTEERVNIVGLYHEDPLSFDILAKATLLSSPKPTSVD